MTDTERIEWIFERLEFDGYGYWMPDICIKAESQLPHHRPAPTIDEFRAVLDEMAEQ